MKVIVILLISFLVLCLTILYFILSFKNNRCDKYVKYVLVLGARILDENTPCKVLEERLKKASVYLKKFNSKVIVSGGMGIDEPVCESEVMKKFLISLGVLEENILTESYSKNTFENIKNTKGMIKEKDEILIITSSYHLFRANLIAKRVGFKRVYSIGSDISKESRFKNIFREIFAVIKSFLFDW